MANEIRIRSEGTLRWITQAGGSGYVPGASVTGATGAAVATLLGYVQDGMSIQQDHQVEPVFNRGVVQHYKQTQIAAGRVNFSVFYAPSGVTGDLIPTATAAGASSTLPLFWLEWKSTAPEQGSAFYYDFLNCTHANSPKLTEGERGNRLEYSFYFTHFNGPTASGYLG